jgi:hypothetical protein
MLLVWQLTDMKRARFRVDSTPHDDKLVSCDRLRCFQPRKEHVDSDSSSIGSSRTRQRQRQRQRRNVGGGRKATKKSYKEEEEEEEAAEDDDKR